MNLREPVIKRIVQLMKDPQKGVSIKDRTFHFHVFQDCFVGQECVTWILVNFHYLVENRERAALLGQVLLDKGIIYHASNDQPFRDGYFFYTFQKFPEISDAEMDVIVIRMKAHPTGVTIQDRSHHLRHYRDCFVVLGSEAVDWLVKNVPNYATSRSMAVKLGQEMMNKGIMHSSTQHPFADTHDFYYFQRIIQSGYLGKLSKEGTEWKTRWFAVKDMKEKKLWYYNSPRDPVPRDFIPLYGASLRVVLDQDLSFLEIHTPLRIFSLRPTSSSVLSRWVSCISSFVGFDGFEDNLRMERAERSICVHECGLSSKMIKEMKLPTVGLSLGEVVESGLLEEDDDGLNSSRDILETSMDSTFNTFSTSSSFSSSQHDTLNTSNSTNFIHNNNNNNNNNHDDGGNYLAKTPRKLELMKDNLDIYQVDDDPPFPSPIRVPEEHFQTLYEYGFIGEGHFLPPPSFPPHLSCKGNNTCNGDDDHCNGKQDDGMTAEMQEVIERLSRHLASTQDNEFIPNPDTLIPKTHEIDILPSLSRIPPQPSFPPSPPHSRSHSSSNPPRASPRITSAPRSRSHSSNSNFIPYTSQPSQHNSGHYQSFHFM